MNYLDKIGLKRFWENIKSKTVLSDVVRKIEVVDALPETEVEGILYLVKTSQETEPIEPEIVNLYYQDEEKNYTSSSGINYIFGIDKTLTLNGTPSSSASTYSNDFTMDLSTSKTYRLTLKYKSGSLKLNSSNAYKIYVYLGNDSSSHSQLLELISTSAEDDLTGTFTTTVEGSQIYGLRIYVYKSNEYTDLKYDVVIEEVKE